jgi:excinuclease ABC subunit A
MKICSECMGEGLNPLASSVTINGKRLPELSNYSLIELSNWLEDLKNDFDDKLLETIKPYILDLETILKRIIKMGIGYLGISRQSNTLSGGEYQRIKLSSMLDSTMSGLTYILDEPTIGLHSIDTMGLIDNLKELRDMGNTVILIEHDLDIIKNADYLIDFGPFSGKNGGYVVFQGNPKDIEKSINSITKNYINKIFNLKEEPRISKSVLTINNLSKNNLKIDKVSFPIGNLTCVCGVSGSGKSSLVFDELYENLIYPQGKIETDISFDSIICIDQDSSVRNKRSNIATYSGIYDHIRKIFASTKNAKELNFNIKHFSFNTKGGRCENCEGLGYVTSNMLFFENMDVVCPICNGNRFDKEVLSILYKGKNIKDVLDLSVVEAMELFVSLSSIYEPLRLLEEIGLGYVELGQTLNTLSGGEIQRLKLARELSKRSIKNSLLLIDEPTTGLHPYDIEKFMILLDKIIDNGNSAIVIEHNLQFIANCDYVIDLGPGGGINGGEIIAYGSPKELSENLESKTGQL